MTGKLGKLDYNKLTLDAMAKWMQQGEAKPKRDYRKWKKKTVPKRKKLL